MNQDDQLNEDEYQKLLSDPMFQKVFDHMWDKRMKAVSGASTKSQSQGKDRIKGPKETVENRNNVAKNIIAHNMNQQVTQERSEMTKESNLNSRQVKSPSYTTLHTPALKKVQVENEMVNRILDFVEAVRMETESNRNSPIRAPAQGMVQEKTVSLAQNTPEFEQAQQRTQQELIEVEKFKATLNSVQGMNLTSNFQENQGMLQFQMLGVPGPAPPVIRDRNTL